MKAEHVLILNTQLGIKIKLLIINAKKEMEEDGEKRGERSMQAHGKEVKKRA